MNFSQRFELLLELADRLGVQVRAEPLGGDGGGLCTLRGQQVLFVDTQADLQSRYEKTLGALAALGDLDKHYVLPEIRQDLQKYRRQGGYEH